MQEIDFILNTNKLSEFKTDRIYAEFLIAYPTQNITPIIPSRLIV